MGAITPGLSGNSRPMGVSIIILVLLLIVPAIRDILSLPILPLISQALPIITPPRRARLAGEAVIINPTLPVMPLCLRANLLPG